MGIRHSVRYAAESLGWQSFALFERFVNAPDFPNHVDIYTRNVNSVFKLFTQCKLIPRFPLTQTC